MTDGFDFEKYYADLTKEFSGLLEEALDWIAWPIHMSKEDTVAFDDFIKRAKEALDQVREPNV